MELALRPDVKPLAPVRWSWKADGPAVGTLAVLAILLFWQVILGGEFVPRGGGDLVSFIYPRYAFVAQSVRHGVLPLWDPYLYGGQPYLADIQSGLLYPLNLVAFLVFRNFDYRKLELLAIAHYALAGIFAYIFARQLRLGRFGALTAGIVWEASGFLVAHLGHYNLIAVAIWIPLVLALIQSALEGRSVAWLAAAAMVLAISTFAGHTQLTLYLGLFITIYVVAYGWAHRTWLRSLLSLVVVAGGGVILCLVQLWPSYELTRLSVRADLTYDDAIAFSFLPQKLILLLIPHFYGRSPDSYWGPPSLTENYLYVGILPLAFAVAALFLVRDWRTRTFAVIAGLGLFLSFAEWTPLHGWLFEAVPGFDKVRAPGRFLVFVDLGLAMLAGLGADALRRPLPARVRPAYRLFLTGWAVFTISLVAIAGPLVYLRLFLNQAQARAYVDQLSTATSSFALSLGFVVATMGLLLAFRYRWLKGRALPILALALIVVDLVGNNAVINPTPDDPTIGFVHPQVTQFLDQNLKGARLDTVTGVEDIWQPDAAALYGYRSLWGLYDPLTIVDYYWFWKIQVPGRGSRLYDLLGARYVLGHKDVVLDKPKFQLAFDGDSQINVYENSSALPRAFFVGQAQPVASHDAALAAIKAVGFDPGKTVVVEDMPSGLPPGRSLDAPVPATITTDGPNSVVLQIKAPADGFVVLADPYYPGWGVTVDGQSAPLLRGDWVFRTVAVKAGTHTVAFRFRPNSLVIGGIISGVGWLAAIATVGYGLIGWRRQRMLRAARSA